MDAESENIASELCFEEVIDIADVAASQRRWRRRYALLRAISTILLTVALCVGVYPLALQFQSARRLESESQTSEQSVLQWVYPRAEDELAAARSYNERLAQSGQPVLGDAKDPFSSSQGASQASGEDTIASKDEEYQSLLDTGGGVMGTIRIPQISVTLPIGHGTSEETLLAGAGHLYGTSLPVGGASTHAVITGHRGLTQAAMFTRLDELELDDYFYIEVLGKTLAYRVDNISVIEPDDTSSLRVTQGEDRVTLMTCTPYGVNTHRLLVSGVRVNMPYPAPEPSNVYDARAIALTTGFGILAAGVTMVFIARRVRRSPRMRAAGSPAHASC